MEHAHGRGRSIQCDHTPAGSQVLEDAFRAAADAGRALPVGDGAELASGAVPWYA
jgi:hypothetical protein